jgi:hypothetical protein
MARQETMNKPGGPVRRVSGYRAQVSALLSVPPGAEN